MNHLKAPFTLVQAMRLLRPLLDIALLASAVALLMHFQLVSQQHQKAVELGQLKPKKEKPVPLAYVEQLHNSEIEMWQSFSVWFSESSANHGSCQFESRAEASSQHFHMLCIGNIPQKSSQAKFEKTESLIPLKHVFAEAKKQTRREANRQKTDLKPKVKPVLPIVVQGWIDTQSGRKHFDPVAKQWKN